MSRVVLYLLGKNIFILKRTLHQGRNLWGVEYTFVLTLFKTSSLACQQ